MKERHRTQIMPTLGKRLAILALLAGSTLSARADDIGWDGRQDVDQKGTELVFSPYTYHYTYKPEHRPVVLLGLTALRSDGYFVGGSAFHNSFGQPSVYGFAGQKYVEPFGWKDTYWGWSIGLIWGYRGEYKDQAGINYLGLTPVLVPRFGYRLTRDVSVELLPLGAAAMMFSMVVRLP
jgi:hypothetical protein